MALSKAKEIVSSNPVVVFSKTYCPYCVTVPQLFTQLGATFKVTELDLRGGDIFEGDGSEIQSALAEITGRKTVPCVFVGGNHIGGCDNTQTLHKDGKLITLPTEAGAVAKTTS